MMSGKCPQCQQYVTQAEIVDVPLTIGLQPRWKGFAYKCPFANCQTILGVQMNPLALEDGLIVRIAKLLEKYLQT